MSINAKRASEEGTRPAGSTSSRTLARLTARLINGGDAMTYMNMTKISNENRVAPDQASLGQHQQQSDLGDALGHQAG